MNTIRVYLQKGWTIQEVDSTMQDLMGVPGYVSYWIVSPHGEQVKSFSTKNAAREYWRAHIKEFMVDQDKGRKLAEECGLNWEELDDFERDSWSQMAQKGDDVND